MILFATLRRIGDWEENIQIYVIVLYLYQWLTSFDMTKLDDLNLSWGDSSSWSIVLHVFCILISKWLIQFFIWTKSIFLFWICLNKISLCARAMCWVICPRIKVPSRLRSSGNLIRYNNFQNLSTLRRTRKKLWKNLKASNTFLSGFVLTFFLLLNLFGGYNNERMKRLDIRFWH